jgi:hypothetical protein
MEFSGQLRIPVALPSAERDLLFLDTSVNGPKSHLDLTNINIPSFVGNRTLFVHSAASKFSD